MPRAKNGSSTKIGVVWQKLDFLAKNQNFGPKKRRSLLVNLNSHGFKINLREDDLCLCHRSETVSHYFLDCFLYQEERDELLNKISQYLPRFKTFSKTKKLEIILYGFNLSNKEPDPRNLSIAFAVQNFILKTKRFSPSSPLPPYPLNLITSHLHTHSSSHSSSPAAALGIITNFFSLWLLMEWTYFL